VFCAIVNGKAPAEIIYEDEATLAFMDIHPASRGHALVIPKGHFQDIFEIDDEAAAAVMRTTARVARAIRAALEPDGLNLIQTNGRAAFQSVFHFHIHVVPRWFGDGIMPPWRPRPGDQKAIREAAERIRNRLEELE